MAFQPIGHEDWRDVPTPFEQLPKAFVGGCFVASTLYKNIRNIPLLIHRPP
jgi:hypothetical protein